MRLILGIDPGSRVTGWGIIKCHLSQRELLDCGTFSLNAEDMGLRLLQLFNSMQELIDKYKPTDAAIEKIFLGKNADSAFKLGQARGVCVMAIAKNQMGFYEYAPRKVKQAITGSGAATKDQVQAMVLNELGIKEKIKFDASDALALALCHSLEVETLVKIQAMQRGSFL